MTDAGTVWSSLAATNSMGPRSALWKSTFVDALGLKFAAATWNSGLPGPGMA